MSFRPSLRQRAAGVTSSAWFPAFVLAGAVAVAAGILFALPVVTGALLILLLAGATWPRWNIALPKLFLVALGAALVGYAVLGRGFAHLGYRPLYVGEAVLALGVLAVVLGGGIRLAFRSRIAWILAAFMLWGAARTVPYLGQYGLAALRDGATWGYGVFAFLVAAFILRTGWFARALTGYGRALPVILFGVPLVLLLGYLGVDLMTPDGVPLFQFRGGPASVHLAGAAAFLALGLYTGVGRRGGHGGSLSEWLLWTAWFVGFLISATQNRGGMLAILGGVFVVLVLRPFSGWGKLAFVSVTVVSLFFLASLDFGFQERKGRSLSPDQLVENLQSIYGGGDAVGLQNTRNWRLRWWDKIIDYTFFGKYFWTGKGFGINLSISDGIFPSLPKDEQAALRSPHNSHLTILARAGVPGLLLWVVLQAAFGIAMLRAFLRARATGQDGWARIDIWILAYWIALNINAAFTVYFEGPYGGIWFWSLFGFGIAALEIQRPRAYQPVTATGSAASAEPPPSRRGARAAPSLARRA